MVDQIADLVSISFSYAYHAEALQSHSDISVFSLFLSSRSSSSPNSSGPMAGEHIYKQEAQNKDMYHEINQKCV